MRTFWRTRHGLHDRLRRDFLRFAISSMTIAAIGVLGCNAVLPLDGAEPAKEEKAGGKGPLAGLPSSPGPHIEKIQALADNTWLKLDAPAADPKWGKARGRSWGSVFPYAPDLKAAFLYGEGVHGWYNKQNNHFMDDLWTYDVHGHRWICLHPGTDIKNVSLKMSPLGFEVDPDGQPIPVAQMGHGFAMVTYDTDRNKFMFMPCPTSNFVPLFGDRRKAWGGYTGPFCPVNCSPWMYNTATGKFEITKVQGAFPGAGNGSRIGVSIYLPSIQKMFFWTGGAKDAWLYDPKTNAWANIKPTGPAPPFGIDAGVCYDRKRDRIYLGGGYYPVAPGANAFWCYDVKANAWIDLQPKGKVCGGCNRYGPNQALLHYDSVHDAVVLFYHRLPIPMSPDGDFNPGPKALGIYVYQPATNSWADIPQPMPKEMGNCPNGFYSRDLNAHFIHCASDSGDDGVVLVYRYRQEAPKPKVQSPLPEKWDYGAPMKKAAARFKGKEGVVIHVGASDTIANPYTTWARSGKGKTAEDEAVLKWMHTEAKDKTDGWWLCRQELVSHRAYTAESGLESAWLFEEGAKAPGRWPGPPLPPLTKMLDDYQPQIVVLEVGIYEAEKEAPVADYHKNLAKVLDLILDRGAIPIPTTMPPIKAHLQASTAYNKALRELARERNLPLIDMEQEILQRRPDDWYGTLMTRMHLTATRAGVSPSSEPTAANLRESGFLLRGWVTVRKIAEVKHRVLDERGKP